MPETTIIKLSGSAPSTGRTNPVKQHSLLEAHFNLWAVSLTGGKAHVAENFLANQ